MSIQEFTEDVNVISGLSDKPIETDGLTAAQLKAKFDQAPEALKAYINDVVVAAVNALLSKAHTHENMDALKLLTESNLHSHSNLDLLGSIGTGNVHTHGNKALLDAYTRTNAEISWAVDKAHDHSNKTALDKLTDGNVSLLQSMGSSLAGARRSMGAAEKWTVLWKNSYPASSFAAQTIRISGLSSYNFFVIVGRYSTDDSGRFSEVAYIPETSGVSVFLNGTWQSSAWYNVYRMININRGENTVSFGNSKNNGRSGSDGAIPLYILGTNI